MTDRNACNRWMAEVHESGSFRAWLQRQHSTNSNGNDRVACKKWLDNMATILPTVVDTTLILQCLICHDISTEVNLCRRCEGLYCVKCTRLDDRCRWCGEIQGYALNRGARNLQLWWLCIKRGLRMNYLVVENIGCFGVLWYWLLMNKIVWTSFI